MSEIKTEPKLSSAIKQILQASWNQAYGEGDSEGNYFKVNQPLQDVHIQRHLRGKRPYTVFIAEPGADNSRVLVFDFDNKAKYESILSEDDLDAKVAEVVAALNQYGIHNPIVNISTSGTGRHIWSFFDEPQWCDGLKALAAEIAAECGLHEGKGKGVGASEIEIFVNPAHGIALPQFNGNALLAQDDVTKQVDDYSVIGWSQVQVDRPDTVAPQRAAQNTPAVSKSVVEDALNYIDADEYDDWINIWMALKYAFGDDGWDIASTWAKTSAKYDKRTAHRKWNSLKPNGTITVGTIYHQARKEGWKPVEEMTDLGNVNRLVTLYGEDLRYIRRIKAWLNWDGTRFVENDSLNVLSASKLTVESILGELSKIPVEDRERTFKWAMNSQSSMRIKAMMELASSDRRLAIFPEQLDSDPYLLGVRNGVVDLRNGELLQAIRDQLITKQASVSYVLGAECPGWLEFLDEIMLGDMEMVSYLQRVMGYCLTGDISEQCMFVEWGNGNNGKSVMNDVVMNILGDYGRTVPPETFLVSSGSDRVPNDLAGLKGVRFVMCSEPEDSRALKEGLVKSATGGDKIPARFLFKEWFEFYPQFKLALVTNHKPRIKGDDVGIWRRIRLIGFEYSVPAEKRDKHLVKALLEERDGIFQWLLEGCLTWQRYGLNEPGSVLKATNEYRNEEDLVRCWFLDNCKKIESSDEIESRKLYANYRAWMMSEGAGNWTMTHNKFGKRLRELGFEKFSSKKNGLTAYCGIELKEYQTSETLDMQADEVYEREREDNDDPTY